MAASFSGSCVPPAFRYTFAVSVASYTVPSSMLPVNARARPMPVENTVSEKNSMMHTTESDTNAVFTLLAIWRVVNIGRPRKYTPRVRSITAMAKPASDQNRRNVPRTMSAVARQNPSSKYTRPLSMSVRYAQARMPTAATNATRLIHGLRTRKRAFLERADRRSMSL